ncbi:hypothetical protein Tco_1142548 [Tanacetum coccineum]
MDFDYCLRQWLCDIVGIAAEIVCFVRFKNLEIQMLVQRLTQRTQDLQTAFHEVLTNLKAYFLKVSQIKRISLCVQLEYGGMLVVRGSSLKFMHVDSRDTCSDQEGLIKRSERKNIQRNLKCGFLGLECGAQSVVTTFNLYTLFAWNKSIVKGLLLFFCDTHDF